MTILHIISGDLWAGAEVQVFTTLLSLHKEKDINVLCVVFNKGVLYEKMVAHAIRCIIIDESKHKVIYMAFQLFKIVNKFKPNIIHVHRNKEHFLAVCASFASKEKIRIIRTVHGLSGVSQSLPFTRRLRSNIVLNLDMILIKYMTTAIIAVSKNIKEIFRNRRPRGIIVFIPNSVDIKYINSQSFNYNLTSKYYAKIGYWIGTAVRLVDVKNIPMLIKSGNILRQSGIIFQISIFGEGPLKKELNELIGDLNLKNYIKLHSFEEQILSVIHFLDVFVLCSHHEGMPMSLLEAMALGKPVICTAVGGMKEIVQNGTNGILVPDNDHSALADALIKLFKEKDLSRKLGCNAKRTIENEYSSTYTTHQLINLYTKFSGKVLK